MKITELEVFLLDGGRPTWRPIVCRVHTDEGIYGCGEASLGFDTAAQGAFGMLQEMAPMVLGKDPMENEVLWDHMFHDSFWGQGGGGVIMSAVSAIDTALWDIRGKALGVPIWKLLGGKRNHELRAYASQLQFGWGDGMVFDKGFRTEDLAESAAAAVAEGFDAVKVNFISYREDGGRWGFLRGPLSLEAKRVIEKRIRAVREAVGPDVDILLENHARTDAVSAVDLAELAKPYGILFMEEPTTPMLTKTCQEVHQRSGIAIAGGERVYGRWHFLNLFQAGAYQVAQPDIGLCGGITETKKVCDMAHAFDISVQPHICGSPIAIAAALQLEAVLPNFYIHEHHITSRSLANRSLGLYDDQQSSGVCTVPDRPGLGQDLSEKAVKTALAHARIRDSL